MQATLWNVNFICIHNMKKNTRENGVNPRFWLGEYLKAQMYFVLWTYSFANKEKGVHSEAKVK